MRESIIVMTFIFALSALSFFLTPSEKDRGVASGVRKQSVLKKVPSGYQK